MDVISLQSSMTSDFWQSLPARRCFACEFQLGTLFQTNPNQYF
jgi:phosphoribosyl-dephospho-CoA transferase